MTKKDQDNIAKLVLEMYDDTERYDWDNVPTKSLKHLKKHESDIDQESERVVRTNNGEWSADPEDYPNQIDDRGEYVDWFDSPVMIMVAGRLQNDKDFAFSDTKLMDMNPPNEWNVNDIIEMFGYIGLNDDEAKYPEKYKKSIYQKAKNFFMKNRI